MVLGNLENILQATQVKQKLFSSIDEVLEADNTPRKRGKRKSVVD